ncbi:MAG: hypothetical protein HY748_03770 [Elusimicrobia bacterium]|nr:hypothetical protein [Elusimicrobiota bacterium]
MKSETLFVAALMGLAAAFPAGAAWAKGPGAEPLRALEGAQVNDIAFLGDSYAVGTTSGLFHLDRMLKVLGRRADAGSVSALAADGNTLFVGSECGLFKEEKGRWSRVPVLNGLKEECDGSLGVRAMCLNVQKAKKGGRPRKTLFLSLEDASTESVEPLGLFAYDVAKGTGAPFTALKAFGSPPVTAMLCAGERVYFGTDDEPQVPQPGHVFAVELPSMAASPATEGMPRADEFDVAEITALHRKGGVLLVGRYAGHGTGQCVLAAGRLAAGRDAKWSCLLKSEADRLEGISSIQSVGKGYLAGSGLMANVDAARVFHVGEDLSVSEIVGLPLRGQLVSLRVRGGKAFLGTTDGLVVLPVGDLLPPSAPRPRP